MAGRNLKRNIYLIKRKENKFTYMYYTRKHYSVFPYIFWNTVHIISDDTRERWEDELKKKGYFTDYEINITDIIIKCLNNSIMKSKELTVFIREICNEHYLMTKICDKNINYLWYLQKQKYAYRPFIFMAEMQLLKEMNCITQEQIVNMWSMINSEDEDNFNIAFL